MQSRSPRSAEGTDPPMTEIPQPAPPSSRRSICFIPTSAAARYCGFKTTGALREARLEGRVAPIGRRGGTGPWMWAIDDLNRFLRGEPPARLDAERSGAPPHGGTHETAEELEVGQGKLDLTRARAARNVAAEGGWPRRSRPREGGDERPIEGHMEGAPGSRCGDGAEVVDRRAGSH